jgi:NADPH2:quinone reductase
MVKAICIHETGGPDVLKLEEIEIGRPGPGEVRVRNRAVGLNFIDVYFRSGLYPPPKLPFVPGQEGAGVVVEVGEGVENLEEGDRVAYTDPIGAYAEERIMPADRLVKIPDNISDDQAAAMMLKGMTAEYLLRRTHRLQAGEVILFHAAAGGVGLIAGQWAKHIGATVIGTVGSKEKVALARQHGYDHVINYREEDFVARVREITKGRLCDVVYDSVGRDTFPASLDCLRPRGLFVSFGQSSGPIPPFNMGLLAQKGCLYATRPSLFVYNKSAADLRASAAALFDVVGQGAVSIRINQRYPLAEARRAHEDLEARRTTGTTILIP